MRKVVSPSEVPHLWANQHQDEARNQGKNFYFEGETIYSYGSHFPIATFDKKNKDIVFFTTQGYSNTTSKHIWATWSACSHKTRIMCKNPVSAKEGNHVSNLDDFEARAKAQVMKLRNARKPELYLSEIASIKAEFEAYVSHCKPRKGIYKKFVHLFVESKSEGTTATDKEVKARIKLQAKRERDEIKRAKLEIENFKTFESNRIHQRTYDGSHRDLLRYNTATERFETSQAIEIPKIAAQRFYNWIKITLASGGCDGQCTETIMDFKVSTVGEDVVKIGCHTIDTKHMLATAKAVFGD